MALDDETADGRSNGETIALVAILVACLAASYGFGISLFSQIVPDMRAALGFDYAFVGAVTALIQLSTVAFAMASAWLVPRIGAGQVVLAALLVCGICLMLVPMIGNILVLGGLLTLMGGTGAACFIPMINLVSRVVSPAQRGFVMSVVSSAPAYGVVTNSVLVPAFARSGNWQGVWLVVGGITLLLALLTALMFRRAGLFSPVLSVPGETGKPVADGGLRAAMPWVLLILVLSFFNGFSPYPYLGFLSPYLREELGYSITYAAWLWGVIGIVGILAGILAGGISARFGDRLAILFCYICFGLAGGIMAIAPEPALSILAGILFACGFYPIYGLLPAYVSHRASAVTTVTIFGVGTVLQGLGGTIGNFSGGLVKTHSGSFTGIYIAFAVAGLACVAATIALPREGR